ncbi:MAG: cysteine desulfurase [bacterium]|nr:cysteine desulfurase [bacterium]
MIPQTIKNDFPIFAEHPELVYLDSTATAQKPKAVIDAISEHYTKRNANVHRGIYGISEEATVAYEAAREKIAKFINAPSSRNIIFVRNATEGINLLAHSWGQDNLKEGDEVLTTLMEHHANIVPWHMRAKSHGITVAFMGVTKDGYLDEAGIENKVSGKTKLAAFTHASNVLGTINPVKKLTEYFHKRGIPVLVDGAQAVPHFKVDVQDIGCDFYVFSGHKMLGPSGIGVLYVSDAWLDKLPPFLGGGEMIMSVTQKDFTYQEAPLRFEAGTPAIEAAIGLGAAIDYLASIGMDEIRKHEIELTAYALEELAKIPGLIVHGPKKAEDRTGVVAFTMANIHPHDLASLLDAEHICMRAGNHCTMPLHMDVLGVPATTRMSFYIYNSKEDIEKAVSVLKNISAELC